MTEVFPHVTMPQVCPDCIRQILTDAEQHPEQARVSLYCPHRHTLLTAYLAEPENGPRCVGMWSVSGPMSEEMAVITLEHHARESGFVAVVNHGDKSVN